ncbi:uncharacterized protein K444DRAFT_58425 [Hyaloscypha bicolor E]|uniref:Uncharacterized protein n=1 Tax=Hyaloscypha bicolor E TaxID=1095630 RepID=A0A2J6SZS3_9HELO|nr:uncharacterized protein K444DRAFT_58425 [Hyaloscypha bicolor E]PMD56275.1 hypothetical protein K444DRAFT_58425 [Hyaloscypha bicolor E]
MHAAPAILKAKCVSWESYFYHLPSPILTSSSLPYHTASSKSLKIRCRCALRSRYRNSFLTASLDDPISSQHRKTRQLPPLELTAYPRVLYSSTPNPTHQLSRCSQEKSRRKSRSHTTGPPPWRASAKPTGCPTTRPSLACYRLEQSSPRPDPQPRDHKRPRGTDALQPLQEADGRHCQRATTAWTQLAAQTQS